MSILDLLIKKPYHKLPNDTQVFQTSRIGGIKVDVAGLIDSNVNRFECYATNKYLKNFIIHSNDDLKISNYIVMIFQFGIVNNYSLINKDDDLNRVVVFQFKDAKKFMFDTVMEDDNRINKLEKSNSFVFDWYA